MHADRRLFAGSGFLLFLLQALRDPVLGNRNVLLPGRGIDERIGIAGFAVLQLLGALENAAAGIVRPRIPTMIGEVHLDALNLGDPLRTDDGLLESTHAIASAKAAGIES